jgi:hypothetical protein
MSTDPPIGVFINCPFDSAYEACHHAIVLCVVTCGLEPRSALESGATAVHRMQRICTALRGSTYSIHDLTRAYGDPAFRNLARFNMPFEFGMAFLFTEVAAPLGDSHEWLALVPDTNPRAEFLSDLAGYDLEPCDGTAESVIAPILAWLSTRPDVSLPPGVTPTVLADLLPELETLIEAGNLAWHGHLPWTQLVKIVRDLVASRLV